MAEKLLNEAPDIFGIETDAEIDNEAEARKKAAYQKRKQIIDGDILTYLHNYSLLDKIAEIDNLKDRKEYIVNYLMRELSQVRKGPDSRGKQYFSYSSEYKDKSIDKEMIEKFADYMLDYWKDSENFKRGLKFEPKVIQTKENEFGDKYELIQKNLVDFIMNKNGKFWLNIFAEGNEQWALKQFNNYIEKDIKYQKSKKENYHMKEKFILDESTESLDTLSKQLGQKLMPKPEKKAPRYCYEVYWYDNEECDGDPIFKKFWSKKSQQQWYEEHKDDSDKFGMYDLEGYNVNESLNAYMSYVPSKDYKEKIVNGYVIGKDAYGHYTVYNNEGHFEVDKNNCYETEEEAIERAKSLKKGIAIEVDESLKEENLPDVELEEPITISDTKFELEEPSEEVVLNANVGLINDLISREWELINEYKSIIATLELDKQEELIAILNSVVDEKTIQLGMLNKAVELLDDDSVELMKQGEDKAEEILAETEAPLDESLNKEEK